MAKYFIDATNGSDSNNGLRSNTAWATLEKYNTTVVVGGLSQPGDEVVLSGTFREFQHCVLNFNGYTGERRG